MAAGGSLQKEQRAPCPGRDNAGVSGNAKRAGAWGQGGQQLWAAADVSPWGGPADCGWLGSHSTSRLIPVHVWTAPTGAPHLPHSCALGLLPGRRAEVGGIALGLGRPGRHERRGLCVALREGHSGCSTHLNSFSHPPSLPLPLNLQTLVYLF